MERPCRIERRRSEQFFLDDPHYRGVGPDPAFTDAYPGFLIDRLRIIDCLFYQCRQNELRQMAGRDPHPSGKGSLYR